jgi:hypothetical protein
MATAPVLTMSSTVLPNGHGRTIPIATLFEEEDFDATETNTSLNMGGPFGAMTMTLTVSAHDGTTPTLDVIVEHSHDGTTWATLGSMTQVTTTDGSETKTFGPCRQYIRGKATLGGTDPVYSFTLSGPLDVSFI